MIYGIIKTFGKAIKIFLINEDLMPFVAYAIKLFSALSVICRKCISVSAIQLFIVWTRHIFNTDAVYDAQSRRT